MFKRSKEEIIDIVGEALKKGHEGCPPSIQGTGSVTYYGNLGTIVIYKNFNQPSSEVQTLSSEVQTVTQEMERLRSIVKGMLNHFGLKVVESGIMTIQKKKA